MSIPTVEETQPTSSAPATELKLRRWPWILAGVLVFLILLGSGAYLGYNEAIRQRLAKQSSVITAEATTQFELGLQDLAAKRYANARQRFEYVIQLDPAFPGVKEKLAETILAASVTETPTPVPTPTLTPTVDTRGAEELFTQARQLLTEKKWTEAIDTLDSLRKLNLQYKAVEVDGMYYVALRNRGAQKILQEGHLQEGLYDLALAERFGPLDGDANGYRVWANLYLTGASFWEVDWGKVVYYFGQIYPYYPGLRDTTGLTATERFRLGNVGMGDDYLKKNDPCSAEKSYRVALDISPDPKVEEKASAAGASCLATNTPPTATLSPFTPTPSGTAQEPVVTDTTPLAPEAPTPTSTPTPPQAEGEITPTVG